MLETEIVEDLEPSRLTYASLLLVEWNSYKSANLLSLAIFEETCKFSGAWHWEGEERKSILDLSYHNIVFPLNRSLVDVNLIHPNSLELNFDDFITSAKAEAEMTLANYHSYKLAKPNERKKLVQPDLFDWNICVNLESDSMKNSFLNKPIRLASIANEFARILAAGKIVQILVNGWLSDEQVRVSRVYESADRGAFRFFPPSWLSLVEKMLV